MLTGSQIRRKFLDYFIQKGNREGHSSSLVPQNDPTLLFTNAGMNQFKDVFLGLEKRDYTRATSSQKCVRAGGKHNDLENVGFTNRHHTFFEMLGNFSFGDYFKKDAIACAWELITSPEWFGIAKDKLYVTIFNGEGGVPRDAEAYELWLAEEVVHPTLGNRWQRTISLRIIADHARATTFLIGDGVMPANEGRGYVLRKIMRRAIRHGRLLGCNKPFFFEMVSAVREGMQDA